MISILLAEAVLEQQGRISTVQDSRNEIAFYGKESEFLGIYNIYELAHKCKEWAFTKGYLVTSGTNYSDNYLDDLPNNDLINWYSYAIEKPTSFFQVMYEMDMPNCFDGDTEHEAIFKACQWILDNKDSK